MSDLKTWHDAMWPVYIAHSNGMLVAVSSPPGANSHYAQFSSEAACRFFVEAYREVPAMFARIEELEKLSDPTLLGKLNTEVLALQREKTVLAERVKMLEDQVAVEVNLRTKAQARTQIARHFAAKALEQAKDNDKLRCELDKERELRAAADKALEALENINEQVGPRIAELEAEIQTLRERLSDKPL